MQASNNKKIAALTLERDEAKKKLRRNTEKKKTDQLGRFRIAKS
jgi:hypothetical protein